jgi:hypothetical protein
MVDNLRFLVKPSEVMTERRRGEIVVKLQEFTQNNFKIKEIY